MFVFYCCAPTLTREAGLAQKSQGVAINEIEKQLSQKIKKLHASHYIRTAVSNHK